MMRFKPCIIIPVYNHKDGIVTTLELLHDYKIPIIIVDDGSDVDTQAVLASQEKIGVHLYRFDTNQGKGSAVLKGMAEAYQAGYTHALQLDADRQHDINDIPKFINLAQKNPTTLIYGDPIFDDSIPTGRLIGRYLTHFWVCVEILSLKIVDTMCGFRLYPLDKVHDLMQKVRLGQRMDFDTDIMVRLIWENVPIMALPTQVIYPKTGISHFNYLSDNIRLIKMHVTLVFGMLRRFPRLLRQHHSVQHWSKIPERGTPLAFNLMLWIYKYLGRRIFQIVLVPVMAYFFVWGKTARHASQQYLKKVYALGSSHPKMTTPPTLSSSFYHFIQFGLSALDRMASWNGDIKYHDIDAGDIHALKDLAQSGKGAVIIGSHLGNLELSRALLDDAIKMNILVFTDHALKFNAMLAHVNSKVKNSLIQISHLGPDTAIMLKEKIDQGELIVILGDRTPTNHSKERLHYVEFLGDTAPFSQGPFILASLLACPVYLLFCLKEEDGYHVHFEHFTDAIILNRKTRDAELKPVIQRFAKRLEYYCLQQPFQWFNFFDFWHK
ncbi:MAG: glycosyltransferase family 2 protein [Thiomargarita sp.]|nr:glycosyltransferase family 2 protein [Thiomargarita sp.]